MMHPAVYHDTDNISFGEKRCGYDHWRYSTSPYRAQHPTYATHFHSTRRNKANPMNECANKGTLLCQIYSASFPLFYISFAFCAEEYWTDPNIDENVPQPPSRVPSPATSTGANNLTGDATVAPQRVYEQLTILTMGVWTLVSPCTTASIPTPYPIHPLAH